MIDKWEYRNGTSYSEKYGYDIHYDKRYRTHIDISFAKVYIIYSQDILISECIINWEE